MLRAVALRVGPYAGSAALEVVLFDGSRAFVELSVDDVGALAEHLGYCVDGRIRLIPPSRQVLSIAIDAPPHSAPAIVPDLEADLHTQGAL